MKAEDEDESMTEKVSYITSRSSMLLTTVHIHLLTRVSPKDWNIWRLDLQFPQSYYPY